ncbi:MAG: TetR/AcrR family transcriptional regulator [Myxococcota bacterium]
MTERKPDRRVQRTRQLLTGALLQLILEKGYEDVSVQDIIDRANVGRSTFYAHFADKEDLLIAGMEHLERELVESQRHALASGRSPEERALGFSRPLFEHAAGHRDLYRSMVGTRGGAIVQKEFHRLLSTLIRNELKEQVPRLRETAIPSEAVVQYLTGAFLSLLTWWADGKARMTATQMDDVFRALALPAMKAALRA